MNEVFSLLLVLEGREAAQEINQCELLLVDKSWHTTLNTRQVDLSVNGMIRYGSYALRLSNQPMSSVGGELVCGHDRQAQSCCGCGCVEQTMRLA